jgi:hypothetical protein
VQLFTDIDPLLRTKDDLLAVFGLATLREDTAHGRRLDERGDAGDGKWTLQKTVAAKSTNLRQEFTDFERKIRYSLQLA